MTATLSAEDYRRLVGGRSGKPPKLCHGCGQTTSACECLELALVAQARHAGPPEPVEQFRAIAGRRFRWNLAWPEHRLLVEIQGGVYAGREGAHTSVKGYEEDCEKRSLAAISGWRVIECTGDQVRDGVCFVLVEGALGEGTGRMAASCTSTTTSRARFTSAAQIRGVGSSAAPSPTGP